MALNLDDNKRPYFKQLNLDETFDEIQSAVNALEASIPSVKVYRTYITQTGTNAPVLTDYENTTGLTFTPQYADVGEYVLEITGGTLTANKTIVRFQQNNGYTNKIEIAWNRASNSSIIQLFSLNENSSVYVADDGWISSNGILSGVLEVLIYP